ncbi:acyl-CoA dehydrogenase family protein, partial [Acinetobacter sp. UBA5934]|uniref:acyl-CoA dehydrogenase family protein n=1 Tax=Acinetobacter sp. UBA5934 TaxID=1945946 RepID=UPI0025BC5724
MILNDEQKMVQDMLRDYSQNKLKPTAAERDKTAQFPAQELKELGELGALGMTVSEQWGGAGLDYVSLVLALEEIAAGDGAISTIVSVQNSLPCGITQRYGTEEQKEKYLTKLATGEWLGCFCLTEPQAGSDAGAIPDTGVVCYGQFEGQEVLGLRMNFSKRWITLAPIATVIGLAFKL